MLCHADTGGFYRETALLDNRALGLMLSRRMCCTGAPAQRTLWPNAALWLYLVSMQVVRAKVLGFCPGVRRAVKLAEDSASLGGPLYVLGQLVHNPRVSANLAALGVRSIERPEDLPTGGPPARVIIRSHGVTPAVREQLEAAGAQVVDATCPRVAANQKLAAQYASKGYLVIIAGDRGHGETLGLAGYAPGSAIISTAHEAQGLALSDHCIVLAQTTMSESEFSAILHVLRQRQPDVVDGRGICAATRERQEALTELCQRVDAVVVAGGKNSANTRRLMERVMASGKPVYMVESAQELDPSLARFATVGISAGASTPDEIIDEVEAGLLQLAARADERSI